MIHVAKVSKFSFTIHFDERMAETLSELSGWGSVENFIQRVLSDTILGSGDPHEYLGDLDDDIPF